MRGKLQRVVHSALEVSGLIGPLHRRAEAELASTIVDTCDDGRPMPPPKLMFAVSGTTSQQWFSDQGQRDAGTFRRLAEANGFDMNSGVNVLDFGCGCGRIARWLAPDVEGGGGGFFGSDLNRDLAAWCAANLPGAYSDNALRPPMRLADGLVDVTYSYSVFTHLREARTRSWMREIARVTRPGGLALLTFHDEDYAELLAPEPVKAKLADQPYVVWNNALEGSNYMSAWTRRDHFARLAADGFDVIEIQPGVPGVQQQAIAVLRRR